jgi:hypothetical protein
VKKDTPEYGAIEVQISELVGDAREAYHEDRWHDLINIAEALREASMVLWAWDNEHEDGPA